MPTRNGPYQNRARIEWSWTVGSINRATSSVTVTVKAYLRMASGASIAGNWPVSWSGSWGNSSNTQGISLSGGQRQQIRRSSFTVSLTDSSQTRNVAIRVNHFHGSTQNTLTISIGARYARTPTNLLVSRQSDSRINLSWSNTGTYARVGVQMQADTGSGFSLGGSASASGNATSYASTGRIPNRRYRYRVRGHTSGGASPWTSWSTIVYTTPATPSAPRVARSGNSIRVSLGSSTSLFGTHFDVQDAATGSIVGSNIPRGSFPWTHTNPNPEVRHRYRIRARRSQYSTGGTILTSSYSAYSPWVELQSPPNAPTNLAPNGIAVAAGEDAVLSWSHNPVDSSDQSAFELRWRIGSLGTWTTVTGSTASQYTTMFDEPGGYQWQVRTRGVHPDWSPWSATATLTAIDVPSVAITQPSGETWGLPTMTVEWEYAQLEDLPQSAWRVHLIHVDPDGEAVLEERNGSGPASSVALATRLERDGDYIVRVWGQASGIWSEPDEVSFRVVFIPPSPPVVEGVWDEETGSVGLTVMDGRGPEIDDIVNVFPNPRFRTEGDGLNISRVNGHQNPGARYGTTTDVPGFSPQGSALLYPRARVEVEWSDSGYAAEFWSVGSIDSLQTRITYGPMLEQFADVLGLSSMVGETVTIEWQWVRPTVGTTRSVQPPMHRQGLTTIPYESRGRSSVIAEPTAGNVYTEWITFVVTPLESGFDTRNVSVVANGTSPDHRIQVSNVKMYLGEYDQTIEWFDGDSEATGDDPIYWYGEPGESVSVEATPSPKHFEALAPARSIMSDDGAVVEAVVGGLSLVDLDLDLDISPGDAHTVLVGARLLDTPGEDEFMAIVPQIGDDGYDNISTVTSTEWTQFRWNVIADEFGTDNARFMVSAPTEGLNRIEFRHLAIVAEADYEGPFFDGSTGAVEIDGSSMVSQWDGDADDSTSYLTMGEATVRVEIDRSIDDGETWERVFDGDYDDELHVSDFESLSNGTTLYRATGYSLNGEPADAIVEVVSDSTALWLGGGEGFDATARLPLDPDVNVSRSRQRQLEQYEGRALGVAYSSANLQREVTFTGTVPDADIGIPSATRTELDDVSLNPWPVHLYRDPAGNRVYGICGPLDMARIGTDADGNTFWSYSGSLEETEK